MRRRLGSRASPFSITAGERELRQFLRRLAILVVALTGLVVLGTVGYAGFEHYSLWQGFRQTLDVIATLGSIEPSQSGGGQALTVVLITLGVGTMFYALITVTEFFVAGHLSGLLETRRMERKVNALEGHYIVCGYGRVGRQVADDLQHASVPLVVVECDRAQCDLIEQSGLLFICGSASEEKVLRQSGIEQARALIAAVGSDAENVFITLTARELRPDLEIVARASEEKVFTKLERAGASRVVSPYMVSGEAMAKLAMQPQVREYLDVVTGSAEFRMEELELSPGCPALGKSISELADRAEAMIVALKKTGSQIKLKPDPAALLEQGDIVVALGNIDEIERLEPLFSEAGGR